jgi:hypothetical protein
MDELKFVALDRDDLAVISAHVQDAVVKVADVLWRPQEKRLVIALNRFDWTAAGNGGGEKFRRCRSALRFDRVLACKCKQVDPAGKDAVLNLLAIEFEETDAPAGTVILTFSGGGVLRLHVECLECQLADLGPSWSTQCCPGHQTESAPAPARDPQRLQG